MQAIKSCLNMPDREQMFWAGLLKHQKRALLMLSGLPDFWYSRSWDHFTLIERQEMLDLVEEASSWHHKLEPIKA